ncbi:ABC transporter ATP-binding protein [Thalassorhabdomicrobium marinisediminis]|uniref:ABC transporter ATP-binding protein n=1 Tax=Thalassorhabdomicrobium marinisediminis TaxID=2170577 RepID=A0A2T7FU84_9RHOB|nr:ABC transporter ATP-binding protein [Thalassorhabdomicrobium marinisediminis]PVA05723.1 ABC transporter ATP-binding protein [Thalassorhabdomicrobium marinisediminis]
MSMLDVKDLTAGYGDIPVVRQISLAVEPGEILLIGGENGAGKSTLLRAISGFNTPASGTVMLDGVDVTGQPPEQTAKQGLRLVLDNHRVFPELSVHDNLRLGQAAGRRDPDSFAKSLEQIHDVFPILKEKEKQYARDLSGGQQQILALGQAFVAQPKVLLCDEPSMGVAQMLLPPILSFLRKWAESGTAVVIVEQHLKITQPYTDRAIIISRGEVALECPSQELDARLADYNATRMASASHG